MESSIFIIPLCSAVVIAGIVWLFWLRSHDELERGTFDIQAATELLNTLHQSQTLLVEYRDQLRRELGLEKQSETIRAARR